MRGTIGEKKNTKKRNIKKRKIEKEILNAGRAAAFEVDTAHYRGNYPESVLVEAAFAPDASAGSLLADAGVTLS